MTAVKAQDVQTHFREFCARIINGETLIVSRPKSENIIMMSEAEYMRLEKSRRNSEYLSMLDQSFEEAAHGEIVTKSFEELRQ